MIKESIHDLISQSTLRGTEFMLLFAKLYCLPHGKSNPIVLLSLPFFSHSPCSLASDGILSSLMDFNSIYTLTIPRSLLQSGSLPLSSRLLFDNSNWISNRHFKLIVLKKQTLNFFPQTNFCRFYLMKYQLYPYNCSSQKC